MSTLHAGITANQGTHVTSQPISSPGKGLKMVHTRSGLPLQPSPPMAHRPVAEEGGEGATSQGGSGWAKQYTAYIALPQPIVLYHWAVRCSQHHAAQIT